MIRLRGLAYLRLGTADLDRSVGFARDALGLSLIGRDRGSASFGSGSQGRSLTYVAGDPAERIIGFEIDDAAALGHLAQARRPFRIGTEAECERRRVASFVAMRDLSGNNIEIVEPPPSRRCASGPALPRMRGRAGVGADASTDMDSGIVGLSSIGLSSAAPSRDEAFWTGTFGARISDWIGDGAQLRFSAKHHDLALFASARPGLLYVDHEVTSLDDLMRAYYRLRKSGVRILFGPGRHPTSGAAFLYVAGPDGIAYALTTGARQIADEAAHRPRQFPLAPASLCLWGARPDPAFLSMEEPEPLEQASEAA